VLGEDIVHQKNHSGALNGAARGEDTVKLGKTAAAEHDAVYGFKISEHLNSFILFFQ
jgi:hypothetical protein